MAERLVFVRHGASVGTGGGRLRGREDLPLSALGQDQARALAGTLAESLAPGAPTRCLTSPLRRARETAELALQGSGRTAEEIPDLAEVDVGVWEGLTFSAAAAGWPEEAARWVAWDPGFTFPGGERLADYLLRVRRVCDHLAACEERTVVVFTHGGVIRTALCLLLGLDSRDYLKFDIGPACVATVRMFGTLGVLGELRNTSPEVALAGSGRDAEASAGTAGGTGAGSPGGDLRGAGAGGSGERGGRT